MIRTVRAPAALLALTLALALGGCGGDTSDAEPAAARTAANGDVFNDADVEFASEMIPHHADALLMVDLVQGRDVSPELAALTEEIRAAQAPEIELMADWLTAWGEPVPPTATTSTATAATAATTAATTAPTGRPTPWTSSRTSTGPRSSSAGSS